MDLESILYADNHLLAVNKPAGLLTQSSGRSADSLEEQARAWIKEAHGKPGNVFLHAVHRLDAVASGVVLFARTSKGLSRLNAQMRARGIQKVYHAVLSASPAALEGTVIHRLFHGHKHAFIVGEEASEGKTARLQYRVLGRVPSGWLTEVVLETGRYHQIRAQMAALGCAIVGDIAYGGPPMQGNGIRLHHHEMRFKHPTTGADIVVRAPYPAAWGADVSQ